MNVSILIDELKANKDKFVLVADVIEMMVTATSSKPDEVVKYLRAHKIDDKLMSFHMNEFYDFEPDTSWYFGNDTNTTYLQKCDLESFEPINKHGLFIDKTMPENLINNVHGQTYDIHQHKKNCEDDYLTLSETIELINTNINFNNAYGLSIDNTKLRDLVRKKKFTPCFYYHGYVGKIDYLGVVHTEIIAGYFTYRLLTEEICSYDNYMELPSDGVNIYRVIEKKTAEFADYDDGIFLFYKNPDVLNNTEEGMLSHVEADEIRFSKREVDSYLASLLNNNTSQDDTPAQKHSELLAKLEKLQAENSNLNSRLSIARNTYKQHRNEIKALTEQNEQTDIEKAELIKQLDNQADTPAKVEPLQGIAKYNADKALFIATGRALARYIWSMDTTQAIRTGDMVQQLRHVMHSIEPNLLPDDKAIREWLSGIAPDYAKKSGKTPKDAPSEISLIMKK